MEATPKPKNRIIEAAALCAAGDEATARQVVAEIAAEPWAVEIGVTAEVLWTDVLIQAQHLQEATPKTTPEPRTWCSMSDLHIDITEELMAGKAPEAIAAEFPIDLALVLVVAEEIGVSS